MIYTFFKKNGFEAIEEEFLKAAKGETSDIFKFPSEDVQVITNSVTGEVTAKSALAIFKGFSNKLWQNAGLYDRIWHAFAVLLPVKTVGVMFELSDNPRILDYGCGWGRLTRLFATVSDDENVYGVDVDNRLISSAKQFAESLTFNEIQSMGTLPFGDDDFDLIFANSVFSHLSEKSAISTLLELVRVLKPNGKIIISVLELNEMKKFYSNEKSREWIEKILGSQEKAEQVLSRDNFVWGDTKRWDNYGIAIMNDTWLDYSLNDMSANLIGSYRINEAGSQNYKVITKN